MGHWCWEGISFPGWGRKTVHVQLYSFALAFLEVVSLFYKCIFWELPGKCLSQMEMEISELTGMKTFGSVLTEWKEDYQPAILQCAKRWSKVCRDPLKVTGFPKEGCLWIELNKVVRVPLGFPAASTESSETWNSVDAWIKWEMVFFEVDALWTGLEPVFLHYCKRINGFVTAFRPEQKAGRQCWFFQNCLKGSEMRMVCWGRCRWLIFTGDC